jgi:hypothetical protein
VVAYPTVDRAAQQVGRVRVERVEVDDRERGVQVGGGGVEGGHVTASVASPLGGRPAFRVRVR